MQINLNRRAKSKIPDTHRVLGIRVSAGIQQQPRTVRVAAYGGPNQRSEPVLRENDNAASKNSRTGQHYLIKSLIGIN